MEILTTIHFLQRAPRKERLAKFLHFYKVLKRKRAHFRVSSTDAEVRPTLDTTHNKHHRMRPLLDTFNLRGKLFWHKT